MRHFAQMFFGVIVFAVTSIRAALTSLDVGKAASMSTERATLLLWQSWSTKTKTFHTKPHSSTSRKMRSAAHLTRDSRSRQSAHQQPADLKSAPTCATKKKSKRSRETKLNARLVVWRRFVLAGAAADSQTRAFSAKNRVSNPAHLRLRDGVEVSHDEPHADVAQARRAKFVAGV